MQNNPTPTTAQLGATILATSKEIISYVTSNLKGTVKFEPQDDFERIHLTHLTPENVLIEINLQYGGAKAKDKCSYIIIINSCRISPKIEMIIDFFHGDELFHLMPEKIISSLHLAADLNKEIIIDI